MSDEDTLSEGDISEFEAAIERDATQDIIEEAKRRLASKRKELEPVDHSTINYEPFRKDFYVPPPEFASLSQQEIDQLRASLDGIRVRGVKCPAPIERWTQLGLSSPILQIITKVMQFEKPTPIQTQAIPAIMNGRDVIGIAKTGSGKTLAFLLPLIRHVSHQRPVKNGEGPIALIMTPTRELAVQIYNDCKDLAKLHGLRVACCYGGSAIRDQIAKLKTGVEIVICTPGRMLDLLCANNGRVTNLRRVTFLVLDEADRMFDMGFEPQVMRIVNNIRPDKQSILFSATFPRIMEALARKVLRRPVEITVGGKSVVGKDIEQHVEILPEESKFDRLIEILSKHSLEDEKGNEKVLIFVDRQEAADLLFTRLTRSGFPCLSLHGGKDQGDRDTTITDFKNGDCNLLVATSIAARGLDVKQLSLVINYDCPNHLEDYVHRCGRTGRAGNKGVAYTFITPMQGKFAFHIRKALIASGAKVPQRLEEMYSEYEEMVKQGGARANASGFGGKGLAHLEQGRFFAKRALMSSHGSDLDIDPSTMSQFLLTDGKSDSDKLQESVDIPLTEVGGINGVVKGPSISSKRKADTNTVEEVDTLRKRQKSDGNLSNGGTQTPDVLVDNNNVRSTQTQNPAISAAIAAARARASKIGMNVNVASKKTPVDAGSSERGSSPVSVVSSSPIALGNSPTTSSTATSAVVGSTSGTTQSVLDKINAKIATRTNSNATSIPSASRQAPINKLKGLIQDYTGEVFINDYPQRTRIKVTSKDFLSTLSFETGAAITMRGTFCPPGNSLPPGEKKLHFFLEADNPLSIERAQHEIKRLLAEATVAALESSNRFKV